MSAKQKCRVCGCTDTNACVTATGNCFWIEEDLCSACELKMAREAGTFRLDAKSIAAMDARFVVELDVATTAQLISAIQLACRHPQFKGPTRTKVEEVARELQAKISLTPRIALMLEAGWDQTMDVPAERKT